MQITGSKTTLEDQKKQNHSILCANAVSKSSCKGHLMCKCKSKTRSYRGINRSTWTSQRSHGCHCRVLSHNLDLDWSTTNLDYFMHHTIIKCFKFGISIGWWSNFAISHWLRRSSLEHSNSSLSVKSFRRHGVATAVAERLTFYRRRSTSTLNCQCMEVPVRRATFIEVPVPSHFKPWLNKRINS